MTVPTKNPAGVPEEARALLERLNADPEALVKVGVSDIDGVLRGKYMSAEKLQSAIADGFGFCDIVFGWDVGERLCENVEFTGLHTGYPDATVRLLPETTRTIPFEDDTCFLLGEFAGSAEAICPRGVLRRVLDRAGRMGLTAKVGFEYEFFVFDETPESVRAKSYLGLTPISPASTGYSVARTSENYAFYSGLMRDLTALGIRLEGLHEESGAGVMEVALAATDALAAADSAALFKSFAKVIAHRHQKMATFMAKIYRDWPGQSGHIHLSLWSKDGAPAFSDGRSTEEKTVLPETMRHFIGGQQKLLPQVTALFAPTINSYTRLRPYSMAPSGATWGIDNRTCALRVIRGSDTSRRVEYRPPGADANPYLALAAALLSGFWGIEHEIEPTDPVIGNAYDRALPDDLQLPETLWDATRAFRESEVVADWLGEDFVEHFAQTREWETREFRRQVTDWERHRYFDII